MKELSNKNSEENLIVLDMDRDISQCVIKSRKYSWRNKYLLNSHLSIMLCKRNKATLLQSNPGSVRALIALHHGRKTKSESFASCRCRGRVNVSCGSEIAWINVECNGDLLSFAVPSKGKKRYSSVTNSLSVTLTADGCVNNIKFASYLMGNRP